VTCVIAMPDGARAVSGSDDSTVQLWDLATGRVVATFYADSPIRALACVTPRLVFAGSSDGVVHALELRG
jgi:WD40 repeat protein